MVSKSVIGPYTVQSFFPVTVSYKTLTHSRLHCRDREKK